MVEPNTSNIGLIVPNDGDLPGTWGSAAINPDMVAIDGLFGGVTSVSLSNSPVTLSSPSGTISATAGPTQSQNAIIKLTGVLTANVQVTLPLPGVQRIYNLTTGNFVVTLKAASSGKVVGIPQGALTEVFNDGTDVYYIGLERPTELIFLAGLSAVPSWITASTTKPYLLADGTVYNISDYSYIGNIFLSKFGGNGLTTFAVPDLSGRVPLQYDFTGTRITTAGSGINGQTLGAAGGAQTVTIAQTNLPNVTLSVTGTFSGNGTNFSPLITSGSGAAADAGPGSTGNPTNLQVAGTISGTTSPLGSGTAINNTQPSQVTGIWLVKT